MHGKTTKPTPLASVLFTIVLLLRVPSDRQYIAANAPLFVNLIPLKGHPS
jgi:hypothetical protein